MSFNRGRDRIVTTLTNYLPDRIVSCLLDKGTAVHPHDLIGKTIGDLFRVNGFGHSAFRDFVKAMWRMGLHFDANGVIQSHGKPFMAPDSITEPSEIIIGEKATVGSEMSSDDDWSDGPIGHPSTNG